MAQQHTLHFHSFTCVCYWYALHYNENISTRWIAVPLPLPSTWKDFIICLLWSDFVTHLCWVPDRCLLANFLIGLHWPHFAPAAFTGCFTPLYMGSNAVCLLLPPSRCREVNPYSSCEVQCWEHALGGKNPSPPHSSMFTVPSHTAEWRCQCRRVPRLESSCMKPTSGDQGLGGRLLGKSGLTDGPSASTDWTHLTCWLTQKCHWKSPLCC